MLYSLHIENVAVIEEADVDFHSGFNVLTGETGAGKSILIDAINAVLGERVRRDLVRTGCAQAQVFAVFSDVSDTVKVRLAEAGYAVDNETLLIERTIRADGKSTCRIDGKPATVSLLREVGAMLVNIHGQHENQSLFDVAKHLTYLDKMGTYDAVRETYEAAYHRYCDISRALKKLTTAESEKQERMDILRYRINELEAAALTAGEEDALEEKHQFYRHSEKIADYLRRADALLNGSDEGGACAAVNEAAESLRHASGLLSTLSPLSARLDSLMYDLEACGNELADAAGRMSFDEQDRERTEERLELLHRLSKKYGTDAAGMLEILEKSRAELAQIETADEQAAALRTELDKAREETVQSAEKLTAARKKAAESFEKRVAAELRFLDMPRVEFCVSITQTALTVRGGDHVEFLISANPGEPAKPIAQIASGGELSRIMLAIKSVMAETDDIDTLIFDEVDAGISGHAAVKVGIKLRQTAAHRQILCVTHLAQIAARGHHHLLIQKAIKNGRTCTTVLPLDADGSEKELARIIGGSVTNATLQAAHEMRTDGQKEQA